MGFQVGNQYGKHNNHQSCGRHSKAFDDGLIKLLPKVLDVIEEALNSTNKRERYDMAKWVGDKFKADLVDSEGNLTLNVSRIDDIKREIESVSGQDSGATTEGAEPSGNVADEKKD